MEKDVSIGNEAGLVTDLKASFYNSDIRTPIIGFVAGLGGRYHHQHKKDGRRPLPPGESSEFEFLDLRKEIL